MESKGNLSRREFLKLSGLTLGSMALRPRLKFNLQEDFPAAERLGRIVDPSVNIRSLPDVNSTQVGTLYQDAVFPWLQEVVGTNPFRINQRWVESPDGYVWSPLVQPVRNLPNAPIQSLPMTSLGEGMWVEVTVPYINMQLINPPARAPSVQNAIADGHPPRLYYGQVIWVDNLLADESGQTLYRVNERYGFGDMFWAPAEGFRPLIPEEVAPISPEVGNKRIDINIERQTLSCFEDEREVYYCRASTGKPGKDTETPPGLWFRIWRKMISSHMVGGTTGGGYDLSGIGWTTLFVGDGIAVHSTFWHNDFGVVRSHGCINVAPKDAKYVFRWTTPYVNYDPGDFTVTPGDNSGTLIRVLES